ncbi:pentapeptide repeat-containing protein [Lysinibacillus sp. NPDC097195]|uniref:pentapeptide repeat-containing protein n=1 Tax=Lysinibacillus sp. NPDC097195 TaxID=3364141 RepID=UPI00380A8294
MVEVKNSRRNMQADCQNCFGLCCTALNIVASSDFAMNKPAGVPCANLQSNFGCQIHHTLRNKGFKGCTVYDCLGAGQWVSQITFSGQDWRSKPEIAANMFQVFPIMEQLFEMIAFINEAISYDLSQPFSEQLLEQLEKMQNFIKLDVEGLLALHIPSIRQPINDLLLKTSEQIRKQFNMGNKNTRNTNCRGADWTGKNLKGKDLTATDLRGAYLIATNLQNADLRAADFIGADLRDANVCGANLSTAMFLTQMQINSAIGDDQTKLPFYLSMPPHWHNKKETD